MSLTWPLALLALLLLPAGAAVYVWLSRRRARYAVRFTNLGVLAAVAGPSRSWRRWIAPALFALALAVCTGALARPNVTVSVAREDASVVLTVDTSGSMLADDVRPTRLEAAREAMLKFLDRLPERYRVGIVAFSSEPSVVSPLTHDRDVVRESVGYLYPGARTAVGDALARSVELAQSLETPPPASDAPPPPVPADPEEQPAQAIVLLSDGAQTVGALQPLEAAERARAAGIPVYTVALGTATGTVTFGYPPYERTIPVPPDTRTLREIAEVTDGKAYTAASQAKLNAVYEELGSRIGRTREPREATFVLLGAGALLALGAVLAGALLGPRLP